MAVVPLRIAFLSRTEINIRFLSEGLPGHVVIPCRSREELLDVLPGVEALVVQNQGFARHTVDAECLRVAPRLQLIQHHGVAHDATDVCAAARRGIPVAVVPGQNGRSVAEHAFFLILALARRARAAQRLVDAGRMGELECDELAGRTLCIVGLGTIGKMIAAMAKGFSMRVIAVRRDPQKESAAAAGVDAAHGVEALPRALGIADVVVLALPLNDDTIGIIGERAFAAMKPGTMLVNVSRGPHVERAALEAALRDGRLSGFATDAYWSEPADPSDPLLRDARVLVTPHSGGKSIEAIRRTVQAVRDNIGRLARGEALVGVVNAAELPDQET